ncbi:MAG: hypothetical protein R3D25_10430 [Geminicoccaceae bacterium]
MPGFRLASFAIDRLGARSGPLAAEERVLQALALRAADADLVALQGVTSAAALDRFRQSEIARAGGLDYRHALLIEGNDPRAGHPALLGRLPIVHARSHAGISFAEIGRTPPVGTLPEARVFTRDCLEVATEVQGRRLVLFVCHFSDPALSIDLDGPGPLNASEGPRERRLAEAAAVRWIIERRWPDPAKAEWVVLGSLGDEALDDGGRPLPNSGLAPLVADGFAVDLLAQGIPVPAERWTWHLAATGTYRQHDHLLLSPALARRNRDAEPWLVRGGLAWCAERYGGPRFPRVGWLEPAASSHCPVVVDLAFNG